ncbi:MAG: hypothetical protein DMD35_02045 [Gemmatimonadetes bacterium]|nr:MAG: hypothetical protein DMD35_02045 [Gemmatimonadota bacterium]HMC56220.1 hypothetical protein [Gemmatimonadaceae bacterium]
MHATRTRSGAVTSFATLAFLTLIGCDSSTTAPSATTPSPSDASLTTGNGAPSGAHFNLNIIGVSKDKSADFSGGNGGRIFVDLVGSTKINLTEGSYQVLDANGTDGTAAFQLPNPDNGSGQLAYSVWVRALGKPGGKASMASCFTELSTATTWCNSGELTVNLNRVSGGQKFVDVSKGLLQVCADVDADPLVTTLQLVPLFSDLGTDYFWQYDNSGLKLAQMRFYPISTTTAGGACTRTAK